MICAATNSRVLAAACAAVAVFAAVPASGMTLAEALQRAAEHDPAVAVSLAQYRADREAGREERGSLLPSVAVGGNYYYARTESEGVITQSGETYTVEDKYPSWVAQIEARQPLFRLDWFARTDRARALDETADAALRGRTHQLLLRVAERYFGVLQAQDQLAQAEAEAHAVRESLEDTQKRYEVEVVPGTDLKEAQARDDLAQARLLTARTALDTAQDALDEVTGNGYVKLPGLPQEVAFPPLAPADPEKWIEAALEQSPRIAQARQSALIAAANSRSSRSASLPVLDLVGSASHQDTSEFMFGQKQDDARIGVELSIPIYAGGVNAARIRRAEADALAAEAELKRITLETTRETRQRFRQVANAYYESDAFRRSLESAQAAEAATQAGYDAGTRTITDVLDAKSRVVQARRELNSTRYNLLLSLLQLRQLTGELTDQDFVRIDRLLRYPPEH